jgi:hypothetical protein
MSDIELLCWSDSTAQRTNQKSGDMDVISVRYYDQQCRSCRVALFRPFPGTPLL